MTSRSAIRQPDKSCITSSPNIGRTEWRLGTMQIEVGEVVEVVYSKSKGVLSYGCWSVRESRDRGRGEEGRYGWA